MRPIDTKHMSCEEEIIYLRNQVNKYRYDDLTGLKLRKDFVCDLDYLFDTRDFTLIMVDVNDLKGANNISYAHGDALIQFVVNELKECFDEEDIYRYGGDEFMIITDKNHNLLCSSKRFSITSQQSSEFRTIPKLLNACDLGLKAQKEDHYKNHTRRR